MFNESALEEVELTIDQAKIKIAKLDALNRLAMNPDFQLVIDTGYFRDTAADMVISKAAPEMQAPEKQASIMRSIDAIGELRQYFVGITAIGNMAKRGIEADENTREELLAENLRVGA